MKTEEDIRKFLAEFDSSSDKFPGLSYEQGLEEALLCVIGELSDEEFFGAL